ncbi:MAG: glycerate kinase [Thiohalocapsa sp.]|nr:glycerate kinase [Thiohalocapsa sp.]
MSMRILIAPSGFKESLSVLDVTEAMTRGVLSALPDARIIKAPLVDGGEGFTEALTEATGGTLHRVTVTGPIGAPVEAKIGFLGGAPVKTAVLEMAAAAGLRLVPRDRRDPCLTSSRGVGELILAALDAGAERILIGCGDSGINDGGAGMAQALGVRLLDEHGQEIGPGGAELARLARIDVGRRDPRLERVRIDAAVNWHNALLGPRGVARVFAPQKGATPEQVSLLEAALENYAAVIQRDLGIIISAQPGAGASGGLGAGLHALLGARLHPRYDIVMQYLNLDTLLTQADLVLTAEGSLDEQTPYGKIPAEVARRAKQCGLPVIALAGTLGTGAQQNLEHGIDAYASILQRPCSLDAAIAEAGDLLAQATEGVMRMLRVGASIKPARRETRRHSTLRRTPRARRRSGIRHRPKDASTVGC